MKSYHLERLAEAYHASDPTLTGSEALAAATVLRRLLHALDRQQSRSDARLRERCMLMPPEVLDDPWASTSEES